MAKLPIPTKTPPGPAVMVSDPKKYPVIPSRPFDANAFICPPYSKSVPAVSIYAIRVYTLS